MQPGKNKWIYIGAGLIIVIIIFSLVSAKKQSPKDIQKTPPVTIETEFTEPPVETSVSLTILTPLNYANVNTASVTVKGKTQANAEVYVNEIDSRADASGNFMVNYQLEEGENYLIVGASDDEGNVSEQELTVFFEG